MEATNQDLLLNKRNITQYIEIDNLYPVLDNFVMG